MFRSDGKEGKPENRPIVTVLMAVYNGETYLASAIDSVCEQTFTDWELVVIDDGSTDQTPAILAAHAKSEDRLKIIHQKNQGQTAALNNGLAISKGDYVARLDADDTMHSERLEKQVLFMNNHPEVALLGSALNFIDENGAVFHTKSVPCEHEAIQKIAHRLNPFVHSSVIFRRDIVNQLGGYNPKYGPAQDYELWMRLLTFARAANLPYPLVNIRYHANQMSSTSRRRQIRETIQIKCKAAFRNRFNFMDYIHLCKSVVQYILPEHYAKVLGI